MMLYASRSKWPIVSALILLFLLPLFLPKLLAQENWQGRTESKYSFENEPSVKLGPWVRDLKVGPGMNAVGKCLKGSEFVGQNLQGAIFDGCNLDGVEFWNAIWTGLLLRARV